MDSAQLSQLADLEAIKQLKARYFRTMDTKDWDGFGDVFSEDCILQNGPVDQPPVIGRAAIVEYVSFHIQHMVTVHHGHMPEIELSGDGTASGIWSMFDQLRTPDAWMDGFGHYHEEYRRCEDGRWRITSTRLTRLWVRSSSTDWTKALWPEAPDWALES